MCCRRRSRRTRYGRMPGGQQAAAGAANAIHAAASNISGTGHDQWRRLPLQGGPLRLPSTSGFPRVYSGNGNGNINIVLLVGKMGGGVYPNCLCVCARRGFEFALTHLLGMINETLTRRDGAAERGGEEKGGGGALPHIMR